MRGAAPLALALLLAACQDEPDFDTRYDQAAQTIEARAKTIDADITESEQAAAAASRLSESEKPANPRPSSGE